MKRDEWISLVLMQSIDVMSSSDKHHGHVASGGSRGDMKGLPWIVFCSMFLCDVHYGVMFFFSFSVTRFYISYQGPLLSNC